MVGTLERKKRRSAVLALLPMVLFTMVFIMGPMIYLIILSFSTKGDGVAIHFIFTLENYKRIWQQEVYRKIFISSFGMAFLTTFLVSLLGYPFGYFMARLTRRWRGRVTSLLMIPFWVSSLLRLYGWKILLRDSGFIARIPMLLGFTDKPIMILDTYGGTLVGMVYALLPFMIFAVYSSAEKLDWRLVEASRDLGATSWQAFSTISFPLTLPGLLSGVILTFIPSMGLIFIAEVLGGNRVLLIGNVIHQSATTGHNQPFAAALSVVLLFFTTVFLILYRKVFRVDELEGLV